jgi:hypothetical protein
MPHKIDIKYRPDDASTHVNLDEWTVSSTELEPGSWIFCAKGPCPACGATISGCTESRPPPLEAALRELRAANVISEREFEKKLKGLSEDEKTPAVPIPIHVDCNCDFNHGYEGATGCGRYVVVGFVEDKA